MGTPQRIVVFDHEESMHELGRAYLEMGPAAESHQTNQNAARPAGR